MIERATAVEMIRRAKHGRTEPLLMTCETEGGEFLELFCKLSAGCDQGVINLAHEAIAACLAADLNLPIPKPFITEIPDSLVQTVDDPSIAASISQSAPIAFGSTRVSNQFSAWTTGTKITDGMLPTAAATLVFDAIIQNPDRRSENPNCLVKGQELRLIDHELAFSHGMILFWKPPWALGGLQALTEPGRHIFREKLLPREIDFSTIAADWLGLSDARLQEYGSIIPAEWAAAQGDINSAVTLIAEARENIDDCIAEVRRILT